MSIDEKGARILGAPAAPPAAAAGGDPYVETATFLAESALCLVHGGGSSGPPGTAAAGPASLPGHALGGGFLTPASAFGLVLARRLEQAGVRLEVPQAGADGREPPAEGQWEQGGAGLWGGPLQRQSSAKAAPQ